MDLGLHDKVILVTGGARGIGGAVSKVLAAEGAVPVIVGHDTADNEAAVRAITAAGGRALAVLAELTRTEECRAAVEAALARFGRMDGLVNNAGVNDRVGLETGDTDGFLLSLRRNLVHYYDMARFALPALKKSGGSIVNVGSKVAETGQGGTSAYAAANGGRNALTREWAVELARGTASASTRSSSPNAGRRCTSSGPCPSRTRRKLAGGSRTASRSAGG